MSPKDYYMNAKKSTGVKRTIRICIEKQSGIKKVAYDHHEKERGYIKL